MASVAERRNRLRRVEADRFVPDRRTPVHAYDVRSFGAKGDGVTDDTAAIQAAIDAAIASNLGDAVFMPAGTYLISDTLTIASVHGLRFTGCGTASVLRWNGTWVAEAYKPAIKVWGCQKVSVGHFAMDVAATKRLSRGIQIATSGDPPYVSSRNVVHDMQMSCAGKIDTGVYIGGGTDANNDFHVIRNVTIQEFGRFGVHIGTLATQAYDIVLENVFATGYAWQTTTCNVAQGAAVFTNIPAGIFTQEDVGTWAEVDGANWGAAGADNVLRFPIASVSGDGTQITSASGTSYNALTDATLRYGAQAAMMASSGNFRWTNGAHGSCLDAAIVTALAGSSGNVLAYTNDEGSRRLVRGAQGTSGKALTLDNVRFANDVVANDSVNGRPYESIWFGNPGPLVIRSCTLGDKNSNRDARIYWQPTGTNYGDWKLTIDNTWIEAGPATSAASLFTALPPTDVIGGAWSNTGGNRSLGAVERDFGNKSGATTLVMLWATAKVTLTGNATFTFAAMPDGVGTVRRLRVVHTGGPHVVTWPTITWLAGQAPTLSADDWFEFWTDGTTVWGRKL